MSARRPREPVMHSRSHLVEGTSMTYEEYLQHAEECERLAAAAMLPSNRHSLLSTAEKWRRMANSKPYDGAGSNPAMGDSGSDV
jgi:hypothetical protein